MGGRSSKQKGSAWERHFVEDIKHGPHGVQSKRVPHSGAMPGYPDDVVLTEFDKPERRVECKYRSKGDGFNSLYGWIEGADGLVLPASGLVVLRRTAWQRLVRWRLDERDGAWLRFDSPGAPRLAVEVKNVTPRKVLLGWLGNADALALRKSNAGTRVMDRIDWLVCEKLVAATLPDDPRAPDDTTDQLTLLDP